MQALIPTIEWAKRAYDAAVKRGLSDAESLAEARRAFSYHLPTDRERHHFTDPEIRAGECGCATCAPLIEMTATIDIPVMRRAEQIPLGIAP